MSTVKVTVVSGDVDFMGEGMFKSNVRHSAPFSEEFAVNVKHPTMAMEGPPTPEKLKDILKKFLDVLSALAAADVGAPAVGSASGIFKTRPGTVEVEVLNGLAVIRVYNKTMTEWSGADVRDLNIPPYVDPDGQSTYDAWSTIIMVKGMKRQFDMIEANAVTLAFYS